MYHLDDYDYDLPEERIAQHATHPPESCKLLYYDQSKDQITDLHFFDLPDLLDPSTLIIFNNSKVVKARIYFLDINGEILFLRRHGTDTFEALVRPGKKRKKGQVYFLPDTTISFSVVDDTPEGRLLSCSHDIYSVMEDYGSLPLPPYIDYTVSKEADYQPVVAQDDKPWSVASPTAALHFSSELMDKLQTQGHNIGFVTLHVGLGTFKSVDVDDITSYAIHDERAEISRSLFALLAQHKTAQKPLLAIGTTSTRTLESLPYLRKALTEHQQSMIADDVTISFRNQISTDISDEQRKQYLANIQVHESSITFSTTLYIFPWFTFRIIDQLITNFHLPKSSLLMLVAWFIGYDSMKKLYQHAVAGTYRFFSFGDAMLLKKL